jgi:hypothetical protein
MSTETPEKIRLSVNTGGGGGAIMDQGKHAATIVAIKLVDQERFDKTGTEKRIQFTFRSNKAQADEDGAEVLDSEGEPIFPIISAWPRLTGYDPRPDTKSALSILLNQIFGRSLTPSEAQSLDITRLVGIQGWVVVGSNDQGKPRFDSWLNSKKLPVPNPGDFFFEDSPAMGNTPDMEADLEDPFAE